MRNIPRFRFAHLPTPVESLYRLSTTLKGPRILVKRDDQTGLGLGGNKTRKLEFLLAEALAHGAKTLITAGALQSNHCRQTAATAARHGLDCCLVLAGDPPQPSQIGGNLYLDQLFGAKLVFAGTQGRDRMLQQVFEEAWEAGKRPYLIPYGGSNPTGATGYVLAMQELLQQNIHPDWIVVASSSAGTQAGMVVGGKAFGYSGRILGVSVDAEEGDLRTRVAELATRTADFLGEKFAFTPAEIDVDAGYLGGGYGVMGETEAEAIRMFARLEGLLLDPVYTGRAAAGLINLVRQGKFKAEETVLFWHTGGSPALFAERYQKLLVEPFEPGAASA